MSQKIVIGTRGSKLALWQAHHVADALAGLEPGLEVELQVIRTKGDKIQDVPLAKVGGKGLFVKEIEEAMLRGEIDLAVHSMKDMPTEVIPGGCLAAILEREDPRDALVCRHAEVSDISELPEGAVVGTSSLRRRTQLLRQRPDLQIKDLRGNVDTRLRKLDERQYDAIILATAGLMRLGFAERVTRSLPVDEWVPAVGQGALGIETRADDERVNGLVRRLHHPATAACVGAERALLARLEGGCQVPIAAHAVTVPGARLHLASLLGHPSGSPVYEAQGEGEIVQATELGEGLADDLLAQGGAAVLAEVYRANDVGQPGDAGASE